MKKSILALTLLTFAFVACKKKTTSDFSATDVTGTTTVKGVCTKNIVTPNGIGGWTTVNKVPAVGVLVQISVPKNQLYPNSVATGADIYSATTNTTGDWAMSVKSNATGVNGTLTIAGFNGTQDTIINNTTRTGLYANYFGMTTNILNLIMGTTRELGVYNFNASNLTTNPNNNNIVLGNAMVTGSVGLQQILKARTTGTAAAVAFSSTNIPVSAGTVVYMSFDKDPQTLAPKMYQTTTAANGTYSFTIPTVANGTTGFPSQTATIWIADYVGTLDSVETINGGAGNVLPGSSKPGVWGNASNSASLLYNNEIRNTVHILSAMGTFTAN
jgi:hypothetical protein